MNLKKPVLLSFFLQSVKKTNTAALMETSDILFKKEYFSIYTVCKLTYAREYGDGVKT